MARIKIVVSAHIFLEKQLHIEKKVSIISFHGHLKWYIHQKHVTDILNFFLCYFQN